MRGLFFYYMSNYPIYIYFFLFTFHSILLFLYLFFTYILFYFYFHLYLSFYFFNLPLIFDVIKIVHPVFLILSFCFLISCLLLYGKFSPLFFLIFKNIHNPFTCIFDTFFAISPYRKKCTAPLASCRLF